MDLNEAQEILKKNGFLLEFRDSSQDKDTEIEDDNYTDGRRSWNKAKARSNDYDDSDRRKEKTIVSNTTNELIEKIDEVVNRFEEYDYFVKRYNYEKIQIRTSDNGVTGRTSDKVYRDYMLTDCYDENKVLQWVSKCLGDGVIN